MSHAHHFLSRLDRVSAPQVELALSLYNDTPLLRYVLGKVQLPERAERVAISLDHPEQGPFLVVTREGRFVTCLGEGMSCGDLPVVSRGQLDGIAAKAGDLRVRFEACQKLVGPAGGMSKLLRRIYDAGDELSREEFIAVSALHPLYALKLLNCLYGAGEHLREAREALLPHLRRSDRLKPELHRIARAYWDTFWALGNFSVIVAMEGPGLLERLPADVGAMMSEGSISWGAVRQGVLSLALKGVWAAARLGKVLLPTYKRLFHESSSELTILDSGMSLVALGSRHTRLHAEVRKVLAGGPDIDPEAGGQIVHLIAQALTAHYDTDAEDPEAITEIHRHMGVNVALRVAQELPRGNAFRFERAEDVPADLAMTLAVNVSLPFIGHADKRKVLFPLFSMLPWVARAAPEQLYLPREYLKATHEPWTPEATFRLLRQHRDHYKPAPPPPRSQREPSRNEPCRCGSGKKHKRCCGVTA
jgi:SEC-C motif-containing protein